MKKILGIFLVFTLVLAGCSSSKSKEDKGSYTFISMDEFNQMIENEDSFLFYIGFKDCGHCQLYKPTVEQYIKETNQNVYYMELWDVFDDESEALAFFKNYLGLDGGGTPTSAYVKNGKVVDVVEGNISLDKLKEFVNQASK